MSGRGHTQIYSHDYRDRQGTPRAGNHKKEWGGNPLLAKDSLGCATWSFFDLPSKTNFQHEYGLEQFRDGVTSDDVIGNWQGNEASDNVQPGKDFKATNKAAALHGATTAKEFGSFQRNTKYHLKTGMYKAPEQKPYDDTTTFGKPGAAPENFNNLINHQHRFDWVKDKVTSSGQPAQPTGKKKPSSTNTSRLLAETNAKKLAVMLNPQMDSSWKLSAFQRVPSKIDSCRVVRDDRSSDTTRASAPSDASP